LKTGILIKLAGKLGKILPSISLITQFSPTIQKFASNLRKTRNQLLIKNSDRETVLRDRIPKILANKKGRINHPLSIVSSN